jgi:GNAT superfamily N-acetyltransferase
VPPRVPEIVEVHAGILRVMADISWAVRPAGRGDGEFIGDMLIEAVNWSPERNLTREQILSTPELAHYVTGWPRQGDLGVIAEAHRQPIGAAWLRLFPTGDPGYGFVAADVPELSIGVAMPWRGQGVGRALLRATAEQARSAGITKISLSVGRRNFAHKLYLDEGYKIVDSSDARSDTMIKEL